MPKIHPDTKANITLGVLVLLLGATVTATVTFRDLQRDVLEVKALAAETSDVVKVDHERVTIMWYGQSRASLSPLPSTLTPARIMP